MRELSPKQQRQKQKKDKLRALRVIEFLDYSAIFESSPVEVIEGYIVSDIDEYDIFASFVFKNVSKTQIKALDIRLLIYKNQNIPYEKPTFRYSRENYTLGTRRADQEVIKTKEAGEFINPGESFGEAIYIPLPESYFSKFELEITGVLYADDSYEKFSLIAGKRKERIAELDDDKMFTYMTINIFKAAEEKFPGQYIPQKGENAWLCCCGHKNSITSNYCEVCKRDMAWQFNNLVPDRLEDIAERKKQERAIPHAFEKSRYSQTKYLQTKEDQERKMKAYEQAIQRITQEEQRKERLKNWFIPKLLLALGAVYLFAFALMYIYEQFIK